MTSPTVHFDWAPEMELGIPEMDIAHRAFMEHLAAMTKTPAARFCIEFPELVKRLEQDFVEEEKMMEAIDFPSLNAHREQHARVLSGLHHVLPQVLDGDAEAGKHAIDMLAQWFSFHLMTMDTALAFALEMAAEQSEAAPVVAPDRGTSMLWQAVQRTRTMP